MEWHFGHADEREGFTASPITFFSGRRLQSTIRECIQNSLDAGNSGPVHVGITLTSKSLQAMPGLGKLRPYLESALLEETQLLQDRMSAEELAQAEAIQFYTRAIEASQAQSMLVLGIHDWGTSGLSGAVQEVQGVKPSPWLALIRGQGVDVKNSADSLGSFGQGAKAPFALSELRTLFYLSRSDEGGKEPESRFIGKSILSSGWISEGGNESYLFRANGFYSADALKNPAVGKEIPDWALEDRTSLTGANGTSIYIPSPMLIDNREGGFEYELLAAVLLNFYYAIESGTLLITLPSGLEVTSENVRDVTLKSGLLTDDKQKQDELQTLRTLVWTSGDRRGHRESSSFGSFFFAIRVSDQLTEKRVGIARKTGMLITKTPPKLERFPGAEFFDLFICVQGHRGSSILRDFENPSHDAFEFDRVSNAEKRRSHISAYSKFEREVRDLINEFAASDLSGEMFIDDLDDLLGADGSGGSGEDDGRVEFPKGVTVSAKKTRSKHETSFRGEGQEGSFGAGGTGTKSKKKGGSGQGEDDGSGSGSQGGKLRIASDLLLSESNASGRHVLYFSIDKNARPASLQVFQSGETSREHLRVSVEPSSALVTGIPSENWEKVGTGDRRYRVAFYTDQVLSGVEAFTEDAL